MRQGQGSKRSRGRGGGGRRNAPQRNQNFDSNGPSIRIRGNASQVYEKYLQLARDANTAGDRVTAENMFQHAEHYFRVLNVEERESQQARAQERNNGEDGDAEQQRQPNRDNGAEHRQWQPRHEARPRVEGSGGGDPEPVTRSQQPARQHDDIVKVAGASGEEDAVAKRPQRRARRGNARPAPPNIETVEAETSEIPPPVEVIAEAVVVEPRPEEADTAEATDKQGLD